MALLSKDPLRAGVSVEINTSYLAAVPVGEEVKIVGTLLKGGRRLAFTNVDIYRADGKLAVTGRHTKAL
jgi:acyl-coenzyme A thioesterase 13